MNPETPRMSMEDVARIAGVSRATVSRSLAGSQAISAKTREKVIAIAREHGYVLNEAGRRLRNGRTNTVSVVIPLGHDPAQPLSDPFFSTMLGLLADELAGQGYDLLLTRASALEANWINRVAPPMRADGVVVIGQSEEEARLEEAAAAGVPLVVWGSVGETDERIYTCVGSDNREGGRIAVDHLLSKGRRRILFIGDQALPEVKERYIGYATALQAAGASVEESLYFPTAFDGQDVRRGLVDAVSRQLGFDGIFAASDVLAMAAVAALRSQGLETPSDVAVVGFDDIVLAAHVHPSLTTVRQDFGLAAKTLVRRLIDQIAGHEPTRDVLPVELIIRDSA